MEDDRLDQTSAESEAVQNERDSAPQAADELLNGMTVEEGTENAAASLPYPVVAIGASAGGLQGFRELLEHLAEHTGLSFVLVTHLAPDQKSYLTEIMERHTKMPVQPIVEGQRPEPDSVYILLPNQYVQLKQGRFRLEERRADDRVPSPINTFFRSVAAEQKNFAIGVILSGADSDGASGLKTIKTRAASHWCKPPTRHNTGACRAIRSRRTMSIWWERPRNSLWN